MTSPETAADELGANSNSAKEPAETSLPGSVSLGVELGADESAAIPDSPAVLRPGPIRSFLQRNQDAFIRDAIVGGVLAALAFGGAVRWDAELASRQEAVEELRFRRQEAFENTRFVRQVVIDGGELKPFTGMNLEGAQLPGLDLGCSSGVIGEATCANFHMANLQDADLTGVVLTGADLTVARLISATLTDANLTTADLSSADLTDANLAHANLTDANLNRANLTRAQLIGADLSRANLTRAYLAGASFVGTDFTGAILTEAFFDCEMSWDPWAPPIDHVLIEPDEDCKPASLALADLTDADLTGAFLVGVDLYSTNLTGTNLTDADLTDANLIDVCFSSATRWPAGYPIPTTAPDACHR